MFYQYTQKIFQISQHDIQIYMQNFQLTTVLLVFRLFKPIFALIVRHCFQFI